MRSCFSSPGPERADRTKDNDGTDVSPDDPDSEYALEKNNESYDSYSEANSPTQQPPGYTEEARNLVRSFTSGYRDAEATEPRSETHIQAPTSDRYAPDFDHGTTPKKYKPSILGAILTSRLNELQHQHGQWRNHFTSHGQPTTNAPQKSKHKRIRSHDTIASSRTTTPGRKPVWHEDSEKSSSLANLLVQAGLSSTSPGVPSTSGAVARRDSPPFSSGGMISKAVDRIRNSTTARGNSPQHSQNQENDVVGEVADILARRRYLTKLCEAFMRYGAPTHRIENNLSASAHALLIDAQFMYVPGAMMCTFIDNTIQANSVELVRTQDGVDFGRLEDVFHVYKCVIHEKYTAEEGLLKIQNIHQRPDPYSVWFRIFIFGVASVLVGPFAFNSRPIDFAPIFVLGCALGFLQLKVAPRSEQFSNVFEVFACVMAALIARGLGSIRWSSGQYMFCFSAIAQSSIAMILPGFLVLNSALELQGRSMVSGSVRMVYAIIYVLFLGFGLLVGTTIYGLIKRDATTEVTCQAPNWFLPAQNDWTLIYTRFIWVPLFACCVALIYRAKWRQLPVMTLIAVCGYQAKFWMSTTLSSNVQVANAVAAFVTGCMANLYSRLFHGIAAASMLPAIYCQVPGGLAAAGSLVAGVNSSNQILGNSSTVSVINNGTQGFVAAQADSNNVYSDTIFNAGYSMVQVAIGISVGLYLSALVVYPYGKRRSGLFSF
ncbi:hypothetical protein PMZ80_009936 [Knufia obscura]|nr:hypothetical protein PMZ80_009936 [Knufia obscura]